MASYLNQQHVDQLHISRFSIFKQWSCYIFADLDQCCVAAVAIVDKLGHTRRQRETGGCVRPAVSSDLIP